MAISKKKREQVHAKCDGHCGYCGKEISLKQMQVDHIWPQRMGAMLLQETEHGIISGLHEMGNLMPSCRTCNHYKRAETLDGFRRQMKTLHERLQKIYILKVGETFGMLEVKPFDGVFYFEKCVATQP